MASAGAISGLTPRVSWLASAFEGVGTGSQGLHAHGSLMRAMRGFNALFASRAG